MTEDFDYLINSFDEVARICKSVDILKVDHFIENLVALRERKGRLFIIGYGGSAGNADHMVNDLMKICGIHAVSPTNNISLLTAVANDDNVQDYFLKYLTWANVDRNDDIFVLSTSGGTFKSIQSYGLVRSVQTLNAEGDINKIYGILGKKSGVLGQWKAKNVEFLIVPEVNPDMYIPHSESMQAVIWHIICNDPRLKI